MAALFQPVRTPVFANAALAPGAVVHFYVAGTSTPKTVYGDPNLTTALGTSVTADANGSLPAIFLDADIELYKYRIEDAEGVLIEEQDSYGGAAFNVKESYAATAAQRLLYVDSIADLLALNTAALKDGQQVSVSGYHPGSGIGGGTFYRDASRLKSEHNGVTVFSPSVPWDGAAPTLPDFISGVGETDPSGTGCWIRRLENGAKVSFEDGGCVGDGVTDDYPAIASVLANCSQVTFARTDSMYATSEQISIGNFQSITGRGDSSGFKWIGAAPATAPDKTGGTAVLSVASATPSTVAVSNAFLGNFKVDCNSTENLIGTKWIYASVQSRGEFIAVRDLGVNGVGHYFSFLYYISFDSLSVRGGQSGSIGFLLSSYWNQINGVPFHNIQSGNNVSAGLVIDTSDGYQYQNDITGVLESGGTGVRHFGGLGVRQGRFSLYFEGFSGKTIDWTTPTSASDKTGQILWENCQFFAGSVVSVEEGGHTFTGSGEIATLNASGTANVLLEGNASATVNISNSAEVRRHASPTKRPNGNIYAALNTDPIVGESKSTLLPSGAASATFAIPANLMLPITGSGAGIRVSIAARRTYNGPERIWEGWLTYTSTGNWVITPFSYSSAADSVWAVSVDAATGTITVRFDSSDQKVVVLTWIPA